MEAGNISLVYLLKHLGRRVLDFFRHWYIDGFLKISDLALAALERLDRIFALRITAKNWLQPLYQDYSVIGYLWGFIFRSLRIFVGLSVYFIFFILFLTLLLFWDLIPIYTLYQIFVNL